MRHLLESAVNEIRFNILIAITLCYMTGASLAKYWPVNASIIQPMTLILLLSYFFLLFFHRRVYAYPLLLPLFLLTGLVHTSYSLSPPDDPAHLYSLFPERSKVTLTGRILNMPEFNGQKTRFDLAADSVLVHTENSESVEQRSAIGKIRLSLDGPLRPEIQPGDQVMILGSANRSYNYRTPGVFDYRMYLADKSIYVSGKIKSQLDILPFQDIDPARFNSLRFGPERWRQSIGMFLQGHLASAEAGIYQALLIGSRTGINEATIEQFKASGCMHLLAISGIHMSLLGLMSTLLLTWIMKRSSWLLLHIHVPTVAILLSLLPLTLYAFVAGLNTPVLRSLLMSCLFLIGIVLQRQRSILFIVAAAALLLLIWKPLALFTVSFQLSFASILAIAVIYPNLLHKIEHSSAATGNKIRTYISSALLVSCAASLGTLPLMLFHFSRFSIIGPVMNLLVEPFLCLWALPLGLLAIPFIFIAPELASILLKFGSLGIIAADKITLTGSKLPFASFWTITPSLFEIFVYYLLIFLLIKPTGTLQKKIFYASCLFVLSLIFIHGKFFPTTSQVAELAFLDVGQGSSTFAQLPNGRTILIDGGSKASPSFNIGERVIGPFLRKKRIWKVDDIIITHPDSDHANGIAHILEHFGAKRLWINGDTRANWQYQETLTLAKDLGISIIKPKEGQTLEAGANLHLTFLQGADSANSESSVNDRSLVVKLEHDQRSFLFPGDISKKKERTLIKNGADIKADLMLAPHHGSKGSGSREFITMVDPEVIIVSAGKSTRKGYQDPGHISTWRDEGRSVLSTRDSGTITCQSDGTNLKIKTFTGSMDSLGNINK